MPIGCCQFPDIIGGIVKLRNQNLFIPGVRTADGKTIILGIGIFLNQRFSCRIVHIDEGITEGFPKLSHQTTGNNHITSCHQTIVHFLNQLRIIPCTLCQENSIRMLRVSTTRLKRNTAHAKIIVNVVFSSAVKRPIGNCTCRIAQKTKRLVQLLQHLSQGRDKEPEIMISHERSQAEQSNLPGFTKQSQISLLQIRGKIIGTFIRVKPTAKISLGGNAL